MTKKSVLLGIAMYAAQSVFGGGLLTNTNQSVHFLRNPARDASTEIDAVYTNPAGLAFLASDGFFFSLNNQSAFQKRSITATFAPFAGFGDNATKNYEGKASALFIPSFQAAYKTGKWTVSGAFAIVGGGGTVEFKQGLPSFEAQVATLPGMANAMLTPMGGSITQYSLEQSLQGSSIIYGAQLGATYQINNLLSVYAGVRTSIVNNGYEGSLKNIQINPTIPGTPFNGAMMPAGTFIGTLAGMGYIPQAIADNILTQVADKEIDLTQSGLGFAPIFGVDFKYNNLNIGAKYEFKTAIDVKNKTVAGKDAGMPNFADEVKTPYDIPALLTVGAQYAISSAWSVSAGYHHFFDSDAKAVDNKQEKINGGINEFLAGVEYRINSTFLLSCGGQITRSGVTDAYQS
ncbi:MAG: aromatic hydrocarbon degradation protein, partial [Paludibacter sp.]|nr:aromatic hydrocarbon degradation protein [Paludibacter sp.]